jgi:hypothetical protein
VESSRVNRARVCRLLAGASLPHLFFDYLGQGFELGAKPIKMLFVPFRLSKQFH